MKISSIFRHPRSSSARDKKIWDQRWRHVGKPEGRYCNDKGRISSTW